VPALTDTMRRDDGPVTVAVVVERGADGQFTAYCDALQSVASGHTEAEALTHLREAITDLISDYGDEVRRKLAGKSYRVLEV